MRKIIFLLVFSSVLQIISLNADKKISFTVLNSGDSCQYILKLWLLDNNDDKRFDYMFYAGCPPKAISFNLIDKTNHSPFNDENAIIISGGIFTQNFLIYLTELNNSIYKHKIYYDNQTGNAVLEDYSEQDNEQSSYEEADNYFYTQLLGNTILITKKTDIDVISIILCSLDGKIISNLQNVSGWSQFTFNLSSDASGLYLLQFRTRDKLLTKHVIYVR